MQRRHKKEQWLQICLEEVVKACYIEYAAQKVRKAVKAETREKAKKRRLVEKKNKKKQMKYLQRLWDKVLAEDTTFLGGPKGFQAIGSKCKEVTLGNKEKQQPSKKAKGKQLGRYCRDIGVKIRGVNLYKRYMHTRQNCLVCYLR